MFPAASIYEAQPIAEVTRLLDLLAELSVILVDIEPEETGVYGRVRIEVLSMRRR